MPRLRTLWLALVTPGWRPLLARPRLWQGLAELRMWGGDGPIKRAEVDGVLQVPEIAALASLTGLTSLHLLGRYLLPMGAEPLEALIRLTNLRSLSWMKPRLMRRVSLSYIKEFKLDYTSTFTLPHTYV
ncbi:hypothetical protein GPECTOR_6g587 [Gonium pectorale]|uniref:Uncharacterized protein n=1 Tax=Gonium pectorale TaxID=33097 RepID=A0A150GWC0_GONPE|nr:hypothetical protein GPECTOR_6g587 [Gonium pectorale]|eukprot:KXZ53670.1 hypothetical protein GPECTOR_6g587 [Gonium pectorale]